VRGHVRRNEASLGQGPKATIRPAGGTQHAEGLLALLLVPSAGGPLGTPGRQDDRRSGLAGATGRKTRPAGATARIATLGAIGALQVPVHTPEAREGATGTGRGHLLLYFPFRQFSVAAQGERQGSRTGGGPERRARLRAGGGRGDRRGDVAREPPGVLGGRGDGEPARDGGGDGEGLGAPEAPDEDDGDDTRGIAAVAVVVICCCGRKEVSRLTCGFEYK
jgi:hypothetical protein